jgi:microcystin degradation protein MlrC
VHFRGAYQTMARAILPALAPGAVEADLSRLDYHNVLRPPARNHSHSTEEVSPL